MATKLTRAERLSKFGNLIDRIYRNTVPLLIIEAVLFTVVAIFLMAWPVAILNAMTFVMGGVFIILGLYRISMVFVSNIGFGIGALDVFSGFVTMILGIVFCVYPRGATLGMIYVFLVMFLLIALRMLFFAMNMIRIGFEHYWIDMWGAVGMTVITLILLFLPNLAMGILVWCVAVYLLLYAASDMYMFFKLLRLRRAIKK
ncbi:MAG: DUF308 domain-containing protein [Alphaproteobacteria bacterium]|nr:DUF308 domain-containing protein [Alphaproteobacteria bacterium]